MGYQSIYRQGLFDGQVAIITGGGTGIGRCIAHELAGLGATVVVASRKEENLTKVREEIESAGGKADGIACNIRKEEEVQRLIKTALERHGRLDLLVNNGGGQFVSPAESISVRGWTAVMETNLTGTFLMCKEAYTQYMQANGGAVVNVVADMWRGMPMMSHSGAARAGVVNLTQSLALEWSQSAVRVNAVAPGLIGSSGLDNYPEPVQAALKALPPELPAQRLGTEAEVSSAVVFLLSAGARYISGVTLRVDAGSSLYRHPFTLPAHDPIPQYDGWDEESAE